MREKQVVIAYLLSSLRITPASAGKTFVSFGKRYTSRDHPRECGKNADIYKKGMVDLGSPPRVREKHIMLEVAKSDYGITPASAGKTHSLNYYSVLFRDHPRECGKNIDP